MHLGCKHVEGGGVQALRLLGSCSRSCPSLPLALGSGARWPAPDAPKIVKIHLIKFCTEVCSLWAVWIEACLHNSADCSL